MSTLAPAPPAPLLQRLRTDPVWLATALAVALGAAYLLTVPHVPDLAAQVARADAARSDPGAIWWGGWYGGIVTPPYSLLTGPVMGWLGVPLVGALTLVATAALVGALLRGHAHRPVLGAGLSTLALAADVLAGRVTFAVGLLVAVAALRLLQLRRGRWAFAVGLLAGLTSPLAAFFLGIIAGGTMLADRSRRVAALGVAAAAALPVLAITAVFPQQSDMPTSVRGIWVPLATLVVLAALRLPPVVRATAALCALAVAIAFVLPSPVGSNAQRLALIAAAPAAMAVTRLPKRWTAVLGVVLAVWPCVDVATSFARATDPSAQEAYYAPLLSMLPSAGAVSGRLEVVEPQSHWSSAYLTARVPLARGWERQVDAAANPIFYTSALDAGDYHRWLLDNAVTEVALPDAAIDFGSRTEAQLVGAGLPYLAPLGHAQHWWLYRVTDARPVADGPVSAVRMTSTDLTLTVRRPGTTTLRVRWSAQLALDGPAGCLAEDPLAPAGPGGTWTTFTTVAPGTYVVHSGFHPLGGTSHCTAGWQQLMATPG